MHVPAASDFATPECAAPRRRLSWLVKTALRVGGVAGAAFVTAVVLLMIFEESYIYFPAPYPADDWAPQGLAVEDVYFSADDGVRLHGWYVPCENARAQALFAHGNAGNVTHREYMLRRLHDLGAATLIFDYRGYGRSEGSPDEAGIVADARAARRALADRAGVAESDVVLLGESLGGGVMVELAAADGARGLVLENTFSSLPDVAAFHFPWAPVRLCMRTRLDSLSKIGRYRGPLLQTHGDADSIIPFELGQRLFAAANEPKRLVVVAGGDHNDPPAAAYLAALDEFLGSLGERGGSAAEERAAD